MRVADLRSTPHLPGTEGKAIRGDDGRADVVEEGCRELRAPLGEILSATDALLSGLRGPINDLQEKSVRTIDSSARRLLQAARDLEDYCAAIADRPRLRLASLVLGQVCEAVAYDLEPVAEARQISLEVHLHDREAAFEADEARTKEMLAHLLRRAIDRTAPGGRVLLAAWIDGAAIRFVVEHPSALHARCGPADVGLALVRRLAQSHRGTVTIEDGVGETSRLTLTLPIANR